MQYANFKLDVYPQHKFSISKNPQMVSHLYSLNYDKIFKNVIQKSENLVRGELYENDPICSAAKTDFNEISNIQSLIKQRPNKFTQFFHCLNIIMGNTYYICLEQAIQHALINIRKPQLIENALSRNKIFDIDNFLGPVHDKTYQIFKINKFDSKSKYQFLDKSELQGDLIRYLDTNNTTPILVYTIDNDKQDFLVIKRNQGNWYFLNQDSTTYKITEDVDNYMSDLATNIEEIDQKQFIINHFGGINIFYTIRSYNKADRNIDKVLLSMFHLLYERKKYAEVIYFWNSFNTLAEDQLLLPDIQNNKFVLPELKFNPSNSYSYWNTQNQQKKAKKQNSQSEEDYSDETEVESTPQKVPRAKTAPFKMVTRNGNKVTPPGAKPPQKKK
ncbi:hypothetical protein OXYTRIMIC_800 [Oxytricha trifallax]|uniref:Uncharacterized protein n=1 Tax=Oxytricha trifallax TaxID=1172189 RepID=A0A073I067_9SPIT|nr:hypothetical protein OXYTRIMIC_800 [Oxytricha trifallax]